ncbi:uncharacterized protein LOC131012801 [Salvia miltiorrhiza]|uniref:uncharacterized protein LOC131003971 n=1 Tax=Salvia miltiorrhiza TaxID=226208 RepID=UPI0025AC4D08|nr:uncharacterized protein LOC131003971 [Salvia miltiorrhiza]XP_057796786.1 uncharacterized protein LOC131012801 [Salvia miltiorrhiza]
MNGFFLKRKYDDGGDKNYLSLFSGQDWSRCENHESIVLPFSKKSRIHGSSCGGLFYFDNFKGRIIICNPTTKTFKSLDPPKMPNPPNITMFSCSGLGYDHISDDYKVVRRFYHSYGTYLDTVYKAEVFSLKRGSWKEINSHVDGSILDTRVCTDGIYINGVCYWLAASWKVVSFDFTDERFSFFNLPVFSSFNSPMKNLYDYVKFRYDLIKVNDMVGVFRSQKPPPLGPGCFGFSTTFELFVRKEGSWVPWCNVHLCDIVRPLLLNEDRFLFLEKQLSERLSQLVVYDLKAEKLEELDIYDYREVMTIIPYVEDRFLLRYSKPMGDRSYSKDEEEEENRDKLWEWEKKRWMRLKKKRMKKIKRRTRTMMKIRPKCKWWIMLNHYLKRKIREDDR